MKRLLVAMGLVASSVASTVVVAASDDATALPRQTLRWRPCHAEAGSDFECATFRVPLDHDEPHGQRVTLAVVRLPASDPAQRLGSIFLNPGGPGGSGVEFVLGAGPFLYSDEVRARYDLVGFDPRGIMASDPVLCFASLDRAFEVVPPFAFPMNPDEEALVETLDRQLNEACQRRGGRIVDHMATADVARDLDLLREAVGDSRLNFAGYSYGSFLGVVYANMFPQRVGALVVDAVLDPIAWTTGRGNEAETVPFSTRLRSDVGAQATLEEFFRLCDEAGTDACAFAGDSAARYAALAQRLKEAPVEITDPVTGELFLVRYSDLIGVTLGALYDTLDWPLLAADLAFVEAVAGAMSTPGQAAIAFTHRMRYPNFVEGAPGVFCSDGDSPDDHAFWSQAGIEADAEFGYFGRPWTWISSACATWEGFDEDRYLGPFDRPTANPVLVVGNRFDPATRYEGAQIVDALLPNSSLLTVDGWGHTSLFLSLCADAAVSQYFLTGDPPPPGTVCTQDVGPFDVATARRASDATDRAAARAEAMEHVGLLPGW